MEADGLALWMMKYGKETGRIDGWIWRTFFGPCGLRDDFLRFPYERCQTTAICIDEEGMLLDVPWLQTNVVDKGVQGRNLSEVCLSDWYSSIPDQAL
jgi:hypothetical protein